MFFSKLLTVTLRQKLSNILDNVCGSNISRVDDCGIDLELKFNNSLDSKPYIKMICCKAFKFLAYIIRMTYDF